MGSLHDVNAVNATKYLFDKFEEGNIYHYMYSYNVTTERYEYARTGLPVPMRKKDVSS